jgi:hypothetical protein
VGPAVSAGKWRRLTQLQYRNTVKDLLGLDADTSQFLHDTQTGPFATNAGLPAQEVDIDRYREQAEALATRAAADVVKLTRCDPKVMSEDGCAAAFIAELGARAYRHPLTAEEIGALQRVYAVGKQESHAAGIRLVVEAILQSPSFLYLVEVGGAPQTGVAKLTGYEVATRLSYLLWNTMPDADLFAAAKSGALDQPEGVRKQAERLLASDRFLDTAIAFHTQLFGIARLAHEGEVEKDEKKFPEFDAPLRAAMQEEARRFVQHVFTRLDGSVETLLTAPLVFPSGPLTKLYNLGAPASDGRLQVTNGSRAGLLTLAGTMAATPALATPYAAVMRGHLVRSHLLCQEIPPPTVMVEFKAPPGAEMMSQQQLLRVHQENETCSPCHKLMDSIGFGFENFDNVGRYRTTGADGAKIDTSGEIVGLEGGAFANLGELVGKLARSPEVRSCVAQQWFRYTLGRDITGGDACSVSLMEKALQQGGGDVRQGVLSLVGSDAFRYRRTN